jgi:YD repeat-containing protein
MRASRRNWRKAVQALALLLGSLGATPLLAANGSVVYSYDALGRVVSASYDTGVIVYYTYDANGNRTQQVINVNTATLTWTATATPCTSNCWGAGLW